MNFKIYFAFLIIALLSGCNNRHEDFITEWEKMHATKQDVLAGFDSLKYGMFIHWGLYSIPAGVWKGQRIDDMKKTPRVAEWIQYTAEIPRAEYAELAGEFNPVKFNADSIVQLAKDAGMKYLVITAKHHEGFAMYHSKVSKFNIVDATPFKRDIIDEIYHSCKKNGIRFGLYYSHARDWADDGDSQYSVIKEMNDRKGWPTRIWGANTWDPCPVSFDKYLKKKAIPQVKELLKKYPDLMIIWYDASTYMLPEQSFTFYKIPFDIQPKTLINSRVGPGVKEGDYDFGDYNNRGDNIIPEASSQFKYWECVGTTNNSWGYKSYDNDFKSVKEQLWWLVNIVSKGGNFLLNIGPTAEGIVPDESARNLREVGSWLKYNGDAVYNTRKWKIQSEGPTSLSFKGTEDRKERKFTAGFTPSDFWFTAAENKVYAIAIEYPEDNIAKIISLKKDGNTKVADVKLAASHESLTFNQSDEALTVFLPEKKYNIYGYALEIIMGN